MKLLRIKTLHYLISKKFKDLKYWMIYNQKQLESRHLFWNKQILYKILIVFFSFFYLSVLKENRILFKRKIIW